MNKTLLSLYVIIFSLLSASVQASTREEIEALYYSKGMGGKSKVENEQSITKNRKAVPRWFRLSNGQQVNLAEWKVVLFMQGNCPYCHKFDPLLRSISERTGLSVFPYTIDGQGDEAFPEALPAPAEVMRTFFPGLPVATPTTFLVNVNSLDAWPLLQGATDEKGFMSQLDIVFQTVLTEGAPQ
ncbi:type-F conjugative transfer system pilin assembly thiol-disulfide isomerase TrbB [Serratia sp. S1B]|nr:type-F conjugative transfer system pilin assembly thiol-disulfide isomerase TrbB [Serratia sp. S1B]